MIAGKRVLGLIPARAGSKRVPGKNVRNLGGKPLLAWTSEAALASRYIDRVVLSTEDDEIMSIGIRHGCEVPFRRPAALSADDTPGIAPVLHALDALPDFDYVVVLQPTSPLRTTEDIDRAVEHCVTAEAASCVSLASMPKPLKWTFELDANTFLIPLVPGPAVATPQHAQTPYVLNGAVYVADVVSLRRTQQFITDQTIGYIMPPERSIDVDTELDFRWCEFMVATLQPGHDRSG